MNRAGGVVRLARALKVSMATVLAWLAEGIRDDDLGIAVSNAAEATVRLPGPHPRVPMIKPNEVRDATRRLGGVAQLARVLGRSRSTVQRYLSGRSTPGADELQRIHDVLEGQLIAPEQDSELVALVQRAGGAGEVARRLGVSRRSVRAWVDGTTRPTARHRAELLELADRPPRRAGRPSSTVAVSPTDLADVLDRHGSVRRLAASLGVGRGVVARMFTTGRAAPEVAQALAQCARAVSP